MPPEPPAATKPYGSPAVTSRGRRSLPTTRARGRRLQECDQELDAGDDRDLGHDRTEHDGEQLYRRQHGHQTDSLLELVRVEVPPALRAEHVNSETDGQQRCRHEAAGEHAGGRREQRLAATTCGDGPVGQLPLRQCPVVDEQRCHPPNREVHREDVRPVVVERLGERRSLRLPFGRSTRSGRHRSPGAAVTS